MLARKASRAGQFLQNACPASVSLLQELQNSATFQGRYMRWALGSDKEISNANTASEQRTSVDAVVSALGPHAGSDDDPPGWRTQHRLGD
jgi:hypothetical protein